MAVPASPNWPNPSNRVAGLIRKRASDNESRLGTGLFTGWLKDVTSTPVGFEGGAATGMTGGIPVSKRMKDEEEDEEDSKAKAGYKDEDEDASSMRRTARKFGYQEAGVVKVAGDVVARGYLHKDG